MTISLSRFGRSQRAGRFQQMFPTLIMPRRPMYPRTPYSDLPNSLQAHLSRTGWTGPPKPKRPNQPRLRVAFRTRTDCGAVS
jgi:hypothetical protein